MNRTACCALASAAIAAPALAQSDISTINKFSWEENCGWMNWRDANNAADGVRDRGAFLSGSIWGENIGWISVGDGTPTNGVSYSNSSGTDFGVNVAGNGTLSGFAWGENVGWINFSGGSQATPPQPARLDLAAERLRGYAWGENIGWINLDVAITGQYVARACWANCDASTIAPVLNVQDFSCFLNKFASQDLSANCDRSTIAPVLNVQDFSCFLNKFAAGCP